MLCRYYATCRFNDSSSEDAGKWKPDTRFDGYLLRTFIRLRGLAFPEAVDSILNKVSQMPPPETGLGKVSLLIGSAGEPPPEPTHPQLQHAYSRLILMLDPHWIEDFPMLLEQSPRIDGFVSWERGDALYIALAAPYCPGDIRSQARMRELLQHLHSLGWSQLETYVSGIAVQLPEIAWEVPYDHGQACSWQGVPPFLRRSSPGFTAGEYGRANYWA
jgi:hypothetical protein